MTDHPILFSAPMVRALLEGRKTQTRRALREQPPAWATHAQELQGINTQHEWRPWGLFVWTEVTPEPKPLRRWPNDGINELHGWHGLKLPIAKGDHLWVRESYFQFGHWEPIAGGRTKGDKQKWRFVADGPEILFEPPAEYRKGMHNADPGTPAWHKRLGRFMPRKASRITLTVTDVRVQRLKDISEEDARAEGAELDQALLAGGLKATYRGGFSRIWAGIHEPHPNNPTAWGNNPWVAAYSFTVARGNIDALAKETA